MGYVTRSSWRLRQRARRCRGFSNGADELGGAVQLVLAEVIGWTIAQKLACREQCNLCVHRPATSIGRRSSNRRKVQGSMERGHHAGIPRRPRYP